MLTAPWPHRMRVDYLATSVDGSGGTTQSWTTRQAAVECLISVGGGSKGERFEQLSLTSQMTIGTYYSGTQQADRIYIETGPNNGRYGTVTGITRPGPSPLGLVAPTSFYVITCELLET
jgi:hypothetical protein